MPGRRNQHRCLLASTYPADGRFSQGYIATEGLEFETADRHSDELARAGGRAEWLAQLDADPHQWAHRLNLARIEIEGMLPYVQDSTSAAS